MDDPEFVLHVWPGKWDNVPSIDVSCLAALLVLQLAIPGRFAIAHCTDPDLSPSGQLPFLTHGHRVVSPLSSIIKYVATLKTITRDGVEKNVNADLDAALSASEKAQRVAWYAHIEANVGDLLAHTLYSLDDNYLNVTLPAFASLLPVPQRYYVPGRIRESYRPRLEAAGLWRLAGEEERQELGESSSRRTGFFGTRKEKVLDEKTIYKKTFERNRVLERARSIFQLYVRLLSDKEFFYRNRPTPPDILLASHVLLLTAPPFPDRILRDLLTNEFPSLTAHAARVYAHAALATIPHVSSPATSAGRALRSLLPRHLPLRRSSRGGSTKRVAKKERSPEEVRFDRMRWGWIALTLTALAVFVRTGGIGVTLSSVPPGEEDMYSEFGPGDDDDERPVEVDDYDH